MRFKIWDVEEQWRAEKFNESQPSFGMGAESGFAREAEKDTQREKEHEEIGQHSKHMDTDKDGKDSHAKTKHLKKPDDPEKQGSVTRDKVICGTASPTDKSWI